MTDEIETKIDGKYINKRSFLDSCVRFVKMKDKSAQLIFGILRDREDVLRRELKTCTTKAHKIICAERLEEVERLLVFMAHNEHLVTTPKGFKRTDRSDNGVPEWNLNGAFLG